MIVQCVEHIFLSSLLQILQEEIGGVKGHFGPINALAFNPDGKRLVSFTLVKIHKLVCSVSESDTPFSILQRSQQTLVYS